MRRDEMGGDQMRAEQSRGEEKRGEEKGLLKMKRKRKRGCHEEPCETSVSYRDDDVSVTQHRMHSDADKFSTKSTESRVHRP